jgi:hypothetical protein
MRTIVWWRRVGVKAIGLTMLAGCSSRPRIPDFPPVDAVQRASVLEASAKLPEAFNADSACESMYNFPSYPKERWLADCAQLQSDLGSWQSFSAKFVERCGMPEVTICVDGDATFAKGKRILELIWSLDQGRAQLRSIGRREDAEWIWIPPLFANPHNHWDPPPVPGKSQPEKS